MLAATYFDAAIPFERRPALNFPIVLLEARNDGAGGPPDCFYDDALIFTLVLSKSRDWRRHDCSGGGLRVALFYLG